MAVETIQLSAFLPMVLPHAPGVPEPTANFNLRLAAIEFCERTRCWRHMLTVAIEEQNSAVVAPGFAAIHEIEHAYFDGVPLNRVQFSDIDHGEDETAQAGPPENITQIGPDQVALYPFAAGSLQISVFLKPRGGHLYGLNEDDPLEDAYDTVPEFMFAQHGEPIAYGALARILAIPKQEFTNPAMASYFLKKFEEKIDGRFSANMRGQQRAPRRTRYNDF